MNSYASTEFNQLLQDEWESRLKNDPLFATYAGDSRYNDRLPGANEAYFVDRLENLYGFQRRLKLISASELTIDEKLNYEIFHRLLDNEIGELEFHSYRLPLSKAGGFHTSIPEVLPLISPFETQQDFENYLSRLAALPRYIQDHIELLGSAIDTGYIPARITLEGVEEQLRKQVPAEFTDSLLYSPFQRIPGIISDNQKKHLLKEAQLILEEAVFPAYLTFLRFFLDKYYPASRNDIGASTLPRGRGFYQHRVHFYTSLDLTPEQVHATGLSEVQRIHSEMEAVLQTADFKGNIKEFIEFLRSDARFYAKTPADLIKETAYILKRIDGELPRLFNMLPRTPYGIREIPAASAPHSTTAYYLPPPGDGKYAGFYYVNTFDLKSRPLYEIEALSLHEAVPGHHLQIAMQQELNLPNFRRFGGFTAFTEGWALYSERLGLEMGFYQDPYSNFGRLSYEMWRACRLVVDTGIHALGWTRQQAIDFMAENTSLSLLNIANEVDRYIAWPGQALAYKIGELKIRELRMLADVALGDGFNLREFHNLIIGKGAVPLDILEQMVCEWIKENQKLCKESVHGVNHD